MAMQTRVLDYKTLQVEPQEVDLPTSHGIRKLPRNKKIGLKKK